MCFWLQFLREELQYEAGYERRQRVFHHNDDMQISVRELWEAWLRSEVMRGFSPYSLGNGCVARSVLIIGVFAGSQLDDRADVGVVEQ